MGSLVASGFSSSASRGDRFFQQDLTSLSGPQHQFYGKAMDAAKRWISRGDRHYLVMFEGKHALFRDEEGEKWKQVDVESALRSSETHSKYVSKAKWKKEVSDDGRVKVHGGSVRALPNSTQVHLLTPPCSLHRSFSSSRLHQLNSFSYRKHRRLSCLHLDSRRSCRL